MENPSLNTATKRVAENELQIHKRISKKFFSKIKQTGEECTANPALLGLCFDYSQNIPFSKISVQNILIWLWVNVFGSHNMRTNNSMLYTYISRRYCTQSSKRGSHIFIKLYNEICVWHSKRIKTVFWWRCLSKQKSHNDSLLQVIRRYQMIQKRTTLFPIRGNFFNACDRDFYRKY